MSSFKNLGSQINPFIISVQKGELIYVRPSISLVLSVLCIFTGLGDFFLSLIYMINISFFAYIVRDSYEIRKKNILPLIAICLSILLTSIQMIMTLDALAKLANLGNMLSY